MKAAVRSRLRIVGAEAEPAPSYAYEAEERRRIASKDWAAIHVAGDRRAPLGFFERIRRTWR